MSGGLKGQVAVVTGSGSGIGAAITHSFLDAGASVLATKVRPNTGTYSATKYAVEALSESMRLELADTNVKVTCIEPGLVITDLHDHFAIHPKDALGLKQPLRPEDIANIVLTVATQPDHVFVPKVMVLPKHNAI